jgi:hypothetical protein
MLWQLFWRMALREGNWPAEVGPENGSLSSL